MLAFGQQYGYPVAIKAAFGGGGRGLKIAHSANEVTEQFESATREAITAFGRGECFVERYLERPRHVETQCLADAHGNVVVISTRDCSLQRRHQKLVEEAPAPFLTAEQQQRLYDSSKAILAEAGYVGAGTCEFLVGIDGTISFLEVNTRLQVEHPVSEEVTDIDLVREMFRIARGEVIGYDDPKVSGHAVEFRINAEDPGSSFLPAPGTLSTWQAPGGPGVRVDHGYLAGMNVPGNFDSLVAKIIVRGKTRAQALERSRRAMAELVVEGMPTVVPFHRAVLDDPAFTAADGSFGVHTRWIETEFDGDIPPFSGARGEELADEGQRTITVEVDGRRMEVRLPAAFAAHPTSTQSPRPRTRRHKTPQATAATANALLCPMQGTVVKVAVADGDTVTEGQTVIVLEAMKMEQPLTAHKDGVVTGLAATVGESLSSDAKVCDIIDPS